MKLFFFLVACCLIMLRAYFSIAGHGTDNNHSHGTISIDNGDYHEQIKWSGKITLSEDERTIASIAPGGYLKFRDNDAKMTAESNLKGEIHYQLYDGENDLHLDDSGRNFISVALKKMIARGFFSEGRPERIYKKGGYKALIAELPELQMENIRNPYLELLFKNDSLSGAELANVIHQTGNTVNDVDKENFLRRITPMQRKHSLVSSAWLDIVSNINSDIQKTNLLKLLVEQEDSLPTAIFDRVIVITTHLNSDLDKISLLSKLIEKDSLAGPRWNSVLDVAGHFNSDLDKQNIYLKLIVKKDIQEEQWISMINSASRQNSDLDKSNLLVKIAGEMPATDAVKAAYLAAAKQINDDASYGRTVKQLK